MIKVVNRLYQSLYFEHNKKTYILEPRPKAGSKKEFDDEFKTNKTLQLYLKEGFIKIKDIK